MCIFLEEGWLFILKGNLIFYDTLMEFTFTILTRNLKIKKLFPKHTRLISPMKFIGIGFRVAD